MRNNFVGASLLIARPSSGREDPLFERASHPLFERASFEHASPTCISQLGSITVAKNLCANSPKASIGLLVLSTSFGGAYHGGPIQQSSYSSHAPL